MDDDDDDDDDDEKEKKKSDVGDESISSLREKRFREFASIEYNGEVYMVIGLFQEIFNEEIRFLVDAIRFSGINRR